MGKIERIVTTGGIILTGLFMIYYSIDEILGSFGPASPNQLKELISILWGWAILFSFIGGIVIIFVRRRLVLKLCILFLSLDVLFYIILFYILSSYEFVIARDINSMILPLACLFFLTRSVTKEQFK